MNTDTELVAKCLYEAHAAAAEDSDGIVPPWQYLQSKEQRQWYAAAEKAKRILGPVKPPSLRLG